MLTEAKLKEAIRFATENREMLTQSKTAACYHCGNVFDAKSVTYFLAEGVGTAVCPNCGTDSVIGDVSGYEFTKENLEQLKKFWF